MEKTIADRGFIALQVALQAGELLQAGFGTHFHIENKEGKHNLVTEYDHKSEDLILTILEDHFPEDGFLSEEKGNVKEGTSGYEWVIDPLDGTVNFAHGIPMFSVSIGLRKGKEIVFGVIFQPITNELFTSEKGKGAYLNGKKLHVSKTKKFADSFVSTGFPYNLTEDPLNCIEKFMQMLHMGFPFRRIGVASLDLAYLAAGRFDIFFEVSLKPWDLCAAILIAEESSAKISTWDNEPLDIDAGTPIALSNGFLHADLIKVLKTNRPL